ncbi:MAG: transcription termination/antitermination protein NusA [Candidatus Harrisonbacteria bacterium]|nr:transcription termination/antitermination protein NusA [Candidatus Harrisonbacteria bacterium]
MIDLKNLARAIEQVATEKGVDAARVIDAIESSIAAAYKKEYEKRGEIVRAKLDFKSGALKFWQVKTVEDETTVDTTRYDEAREFAEAAAAGEKKEKKAEKPAESAPAEEPVLDEHGNPVEKLPRYNSDRHILIDEARKITKDAKLGEEMLFPLTPHEDFGRIAAQTAKQVILQRLREAERDSILAEFKNREGEIVSGTVQRMERGSVFVDLGRATGVMFPQEMIPYEHYRIGERLRFFVLAVQDDARLPGIILSRAHPKFISKLFAIEVPEIADGSVEIKAIAREPGSRTKIAVASNAQGVDPVGSCVGQRGTRVMALSNELGQEKLDIIEWSDDAAAFVGNALSPAKAQRVEINDRKEARVYVSDDQLSLAIGKGGQNVRLAAKLTGWKIDVRSEAKPDEALAGGVAEGVSGTSVDGGATASEEKSDKL